MENTGRYTVRTEELTFYDYCIFDGKNIDELLRFVKYSPRLELYRYGCKMTANYEGAKLNVGDALVREMGYPQCFVKTSAEIQKLIEDSKPKNQKWSLEKPTETGNYMVIIADDGDINNQIEMVVRWSSVVGWDKMHVIAWREIELSDLKQENHGVFRAKIIELETKLDKCNETNRKLNKELHNEQAHANDLWDELIDLKNGYDPKIEMPEYYTEVIVQSKFGDVFIAKWLQSKTCWYVNGGFYYTKSDVIRWWHLPKYEVK